MKDNQNNNVKQTQENTSVSSTEAIVRFVLIIIKAINPINPDLRLTWKSAWQKAKQI